jgi:hypothetical protein
MDINSIISITTTFGGIISAMFGIFYWDRKKKQTEIAIDIEIENLKNKLKFFYYPIHFRLLRLNYAKYHLKYLKCIFDMSEIIKIEEEMVINIHKEIMDIITNYNYLNELDDKMNDLIMKYINHATLYINLRKFNIYKMPSQYGFDFPYEFSEIIELNTKELKEKYDKIIGINKEQKKISIKSKNSNNVVIQIFEDPNSLFHNNLKDDIKIISDKKSSSKSYNEIFNDFNYTIDGVPDLDIVFKNNINEINFSKYINKIKNNNKISFNDGDY